MRIFILSVDGDLRRVGKTSSFPRGYTPLRLIYKIKKYNAGGVYSFGYIPEPDPYYKGTKKN